MVAAMVAVLKFLLPTAYSLIFLIPRLEESPKIIVATKNPIKIPESMSSSVFEVYLIMQPLVD